MTTMYAPTRRHLSVGDAAATILVAASTVVFSLWFTGAAFGGTSTRVMGAVVFGFGFAACNANRAGVIDVYGAGGTRRAPMSYVVPASVMGAIALVAGVMTFITASETMLVILVAATVVLWAMSTYRHTFMRGTA
jgi:hypothetical protein